MVCTKINLGWKRLNAKLNPICHLLALLGAHHILRVSRMRVKDQSARRILLGLYKFNEVCFDVYVI